MEVYSTNSASISSDYPYPFLSGYFDFERRQGATIFFLKTKDGEIIMPIKVNNKFGFLLGQILHPPLKNNERLNEQEELAFFNACLNYLKKNNTCHKLILPALNNVFKGVPRQAKSCEFGMYTIQLDGKSDAELLNSFQSRYARAIKTAEKVGAQVKFGIEQLPEFFRIYQETMQREGKFAHDFEYFKSFYDESYNLVAVVYHENKAQGSLFVAHSKSAGYLLYGGSTKNQTQNGLIKFLHWSVFLKLKELKTIQCYLGGARLGNISNTKQEKIQEFKARFGAELYKGYLWKINLSSYGLIYDVLLRIYCAIRNLPTPIDIIDTESQN